MADVLKKLGDTAKDAASKLKSIAPDENEQESLREKSRQIEQVTNNSPANVPTTTSVDTPINRNAKYGDRPGEKRLDWALKPISTTAPVYDKGGEVHVHLHTNEPAEATKPKSVVHESMEVNTGKPSSSLPSLMPDIKPQPTAPIAHLAPVYDDGGDVDVDDGKHQVAVLKDGERVLTPEQNEQYKQEHGAPTDFGGRVLPNPKGLKPIADTDISQKTEEPTGAKMNTDNAPLTEPKGDISNPEGADLGGAEPRESGNKLRPYGEVMSDQKPKAQLSTISTEEPTATEPKPKVSPEEQRAIDTDIKQGAGKGINGLTQIGLAKLHERVLAKSGEAPTETSTVDGSIPQPTTPPPAMEQRTAGGGLTPISTNQPTSETPREQRDLGQMEYKAKVADYDKKYQNLMDQAAQRDDPSLREQAGRVREAKLAYQQAHPWGAPESARPGILGKLGHAAEIIAARTPGLSPIVATIPGSEGARADELAATQGEIKEAAGENVAEQTAQAKADKTQNDKYTLKEVIDSRPDSPTKGQTVYAGVNNTDPTDIRWTPLQAAAKAGAGADKAAFQSTLKKVGTPEVSDPAQQKQALETAHNAKVISDDEYTSAMAYLGSTANAPATQRTAAEEKRTTGKTMYFDTPTGRKALTAEAAKQAGLNPEDGVVENESQVAKDREKNSTYRVINKSLTQYRDHIAEAKITPADITTMTTITEESEKPDYISKLISGVFDDFLGHPVTGYSEKLMKGSLTKNQWQDMSPAARQLVADYYTTMMAHFANMKATQGTIPRNPFIIQTEMHTIPKPFLSEEEAKPAFQNYLDQVAMRNSDNVEFGGAGVSKAEPVTTKPEATTNAHQQFVQSINLPGGGHPADAAKGPNGETIIWSGKAGDPWLDLATGKPVK